jgi:hypothetical protein
VKVWFIRIISCDENHLIYFTLCAAIHDNVNLTAIRDKIEDMNERSIELLDYARRTVEGLSQHRVLSLYWSELTVVVKGSTSRGNADAYSDIDLVIFCADETRRKIVAGYYENGFTERHDGIFMPIDNGHYHLESVDQLRGYFTRQDFVHAWDYARAIPLHDPQGLYPGIIQAGLKTLFAEPLALVKRAYLDLQLDLDWMRMPITRADGPSTLLHASKLLAGVSRMAYLLDQQPYPADKWLFAFLGATAFGRQHEAAILRYFECCPAVLGLVRDESHEHNPLYRGAAGLIDLVSAAIREQYGEQAWLGRWYEYV